MTSDALTIAIIAALPGTLAGIASLVASLRNASKIEQVRAATDGMKDALVAAAKDEGALQEKKDEQGRQDLIAATKAEAGPQDVNIINPPDKPVPVLATDAETKPEKTKP